MNQPAAPSALSKLKIDRSAPSARRKKPSVKLWPWFVGAGIAAAAAAYSLAPRSIEVKTTSIVASTASQQYVQLTASGYVVAQRRAAVSSKGSGRLLELNVREGSHVKKDDVIARLDDSDVTPALLGAEAGLSQAEANERQALANLTNSRAELARNQSLQAQGFVSPQVVDTIVAKNQATFQQWQAAQASVAQARANLSAQKVNRSYTEIRAPFDGVVLNKNANVGDMITPFSSAAGSQGAVVTMADMSTLEVEADVSEGNLSKARPGQPVEITLDALPELRFKGSVVGLVPTVDRAKATVMTKIKFDQLDPRILPEMAAKVSFLSQPITDADLKPLMAVDAKAIAERDGGYVVFRLVSQADKKNIVEAIPVQVGRKLGDLREISGANLRSGDRVVQEPPVRLKSGGNVILPNS